MKYIFVPISIVGCGKSTVFRTLTELSSWFLHVENDYFSHKNAFHAALSDAIDSDLPYVLVDRNNHLKLHRQQLLEQFRDENTKFVALLFAPTNVNKKRIFDVNWRKILSRGDNHPQVKSGTEEGQAKMILALFIKNLDPYSPKGKFDGQFDYVLHMKFGKESSRQNVDIILDFVGTLEHAAGPRKGKFTKEEVDAAFQNSMKFKA